MSRTYVPVQSLNNISLGLFIVLFAALVAHLAVQAAELEGWVMPFMLWCLAFGLAGWGYYLIAEGVSEWDGRELDDEGETGE